MSASDEKIKSDIKSAYDVIAVRYREWTTPHDSDRLKHLAKILPYLRSQSNPSVLEIGCGGGIPTTQILSTIPNVHITANDLSSTQISLARGHLRGTERIEFIEGDMNDLKFSDGSFHAVVAMYSIMHLPRNEQADMIAKIARWLKPGGKVLINVPNQAHEWIVEKGWLGQKGADVYWTSWAPETYLKIFEERGLRVLEKETSDGKNDAVFLWVVLGKL